MTASLNFPELLENMVTQDGVPLSVLTAETPVMLVFLRHFGCTFCREALTDLSEKREVIEGCGVKFVFVHMSNNEVAEAYFKKYKLEGVRHISDPDYRFYKAFGLGKGTFTQLYGLRTWIRGFDAGVIRGHGLELGAHLGDSFQMPGIFIIQDGTIKESYVHKLASNRPDYEDLIKCCVLV